MSDRRLTGPLLPMLALVAVTAVWGSTFFLIKDLLTQVSPLDFLGVRFVIVAIVVLAIWGRRLRRAGAQLWKRGAALGLVYGAAQIAQTIGLQHTQASVSGFITGMYVVFTPVLLFLVFRQRLSLATAGAVVLATVGLMVLSLTGVSFGVGAATTLVGSVLYAVHIVMLGRWSSRYDPFSLALVQGVVLGVVCGVAAVPGGVTFPATGSAWLCLLYMALVAGLGALVVQTWAQSRIPATTAAVVMTTEPVFAAAFALAFGGDRLTPRLLVGGVLVLAATVATELLPSRSTPAPVETPYELSKETDHVLP
jgi:drug/metabolite transporter (DMT)-like permease